MVLNLNYDKLKQLTYQATHSAFLKAREDQGEEKIYTFSICHSSLFRYFIPLYNTEQALKKAAKKYIQHHPNDYSDIEEVSKLIRWNPGDWQYLADDDNIFYEINEILQDVPERLDELDELEFTLTCQLLEDILFTALSELNSAEVFGTGNERNSLVITITTLGGDTTRQLEIVQKLNPPEVYKKFREEIVWRELYIQSR